MTDLNNMTNAELLDEGFTHKNGARFRNVLIKRMEEAGEKSMSQFLMASENKPPLKTKTKPKSTNKFDILLNEIEESGWPGHGYRAGLESILLNLRYCIRYNVKPEDLVEEDHTAIQTAEQYFRAWARVTGLEDGEILFPKKQGDRDLRDSKKWMIKNENMLLGK